MRNRADHFRWMLAAACVGAAVLLVSHSAEAAMITSAGGTVTNFYDNYNANAVGSLPDNGAWPGFWFNVLEGGAGTVRVTNAPAPPLEGNYLRLSRPGGSDGAIAWAVLGSAVTGGDLQFDTLMNIAAPGGDFYFNDAGIYRMTFVPRDVAGTRRVWYSPGSGGSYTDSGVPWDYDTWQAWRVSLDYATHTFTISVGGATSVPLSVATWTTGSDSISRMEIWMAPGSAYALDVVVPEPGIASLWALGGLALWRRMWK